MEPANYLLVGRLLPFEALCRYCRECKVGYARRGRIVQQYVGRLKNLGDTGKEDVIQPELLVALTEIRGILMIVLFVQGGNEDKHEKIAHANHAPKAVVGCLMQRDIA